MAKIMWLSVDANEMLRESMKSFVNFLHKFKVDYISYNSDSEAGLIYMKLNLPKDVAIDGNHEFHKGMGEWVYYHPINVLKKVPKVSDYDIIEEMSVEPYDIDKWRGI